MSDKEKIKLLTAVLNGVRTMAQIEAEDGSKAWRRAVEEIDTQLKAINQL